jgi:DNA polymerase sigma
MMKKLNPYDLVRQKNEAAIADERHKKKVATLKEKRKAHKKAEAVRRKKFNTLTNSMQESFRKADDEWNRFEGEDHEVSEEEEGEEGDEPHHE